MSVCMHACMHACMYVCMYVLCMYAQLLHSLSRCGSLPLGAHTHSYDNGWLVDFSRRAMKAEAQKVKMTAFYHEGPQQLAFELAHYVNACAIIDLTPGSGHMAFCCLRKRIPYTGVALTKLHKDLLCKRMVSQVLTAMVDSNQPELFNPSLASTLEQLETGSGG